MESVKSFNAAFHSVNNYGNIRLNFQNGPPVDLKALKAENFNALYNVLQSNQACWDGTWLVSDKAIAKNKNFLK